MTDLSEKQSRPRAALLAAWLSGATAMLMIAGSSLAAAADKDSSKSKSVVVEPGKTLFGKSYNELASDWANWLQIEPVASNPAFDPDGRFCGLNQKGKIWYLAGTFGGVAERTCEVPAGKGIFFPIFANISFAPDFPIAGDECDDPSGETPEVDQVRCDVTDDTAIAPDVGLEVTVDGRPVGDLFAYRVQSEPGGFVLELGLFEEFGFEPGDRFPAVVDGYWILLKPLSPGLHTVDFSADFDLDGMPDLGANYDLIVIDDDDDDDDDDDQDDH